MMAGLASFARRYWLGIRVVVGELNLAIRSTADGSGPLFFWGAVPVLNLDEFRVGGKLRGRCER